MRLTTFRRYRLAALLVTLVAGCARRPGDSGLAVAASTAPACTESEMEALRDTTEERLIRAAAHVARRGCELRITHANGRVTVLRNDLREGDPWRIYRYAGRLPALDLDLVEAGFYEGGYTLVVSPRGREVPVAGLPVMSPDFSRFFATSLDLEAEYDPNVIEVWSMASGFPRLELAIRSEEWGPSDAKWLDSDTIEILRTFPSDVPGTYRTAKARLQRTPRGWMFEPLEP